MAADTAALVTGVARVGIVAKTRLAAAAPVVRDVATWLERRGRQWFLASDHPSWRPLPWPREAEVIGEVRWASRTFE